MLILMRHKLTRTETPSSQLSPKNQEISWRRKQYLSLSALSSELQVSICLLNLLDGRSYAYSTLILEEKEIQELGDIL